ncbi:MAG: mechanosensitive ion channel family protein [Lachnospiraceae bacterium]|nr:mechanosensitive ion channel family protein [Lachnospiraceae bacterium]
MLVTVICVVLFFILLQMLLHTEARQTQDQNNERFFSSTLTNLNNNDRELTALIENFNENNTLMLDGLVTAYSKSTYRKLEGMSAEEQSELLFTTHSSMVDCAWMLITDRDANILISSSLDNNGLNVIADGEIGLTIEEYRDLLDGRLQNLVVDNPYSTSSRGTASKLYLYGKAIPGTYGTDGSKYILLAFFSDIVDTATKRMGDVSSWLNASTVGSNGAVFMVDAGADRIIYGSMYGEDKAGDTASSVGLGPEILKDRFKGEARIDGRKCYLSVRKHSSKLYGQDNYIIALVPLRDMYGLNLSVVVWNICLLLIFIVLVSAYVSYVSFTKQEDGRREIELLGGRLIVNRDLTGKVLPIILTAGFLIFCAAFYFQALMKLSDAFSESVAIEEEIANNVEKSAGLREDFVDYYNMQYESRAGLLSFIVSLHANEYLEPSQESDSVKYLGNVDENGNRDALKDEYDNIVYVINNSRALWELQDSNAVKNIYLISDQGTTLATSSNYWNFSLSTNPEDQSYAFWDILDGKKESMIQDAMISDEGKLSRFIGCTLTYFTCLDEKGNTKYVSLTDYLEQMIGTYQGNEITKHRGLLQIELDPEEENGIIETASPEYILSHTKISNNGFLIGFEYDDEEEDYIVFYAPNASTIHQTASELGISEGAFSGSYNGFQTFNGTRCLQSIRQSGEYYIATAMPMESLYEGSLRTALFCGLFSLPVILGISLYLLFVRKRELEEIGDDEDRDDPFSVFEHLGHFEAWKKSPPTRKFEILVKNSFIILGIVFIGAVLYEANRFGSNSAIVYILGGEWDRGLHIFSLSACFGIIILSGVLIGIFEYIAHLIASMFGNRGVTLMKLFISLIKAAAILIVIFDCLFLIGIDATRLLTSAGILSVVVGLGAQSLVGDLLAGIFLVMEGSIHVGDYVLINDVRGRVTEIGLRTTRYEDINQNIRIICNNEMKTFANLSMKYSVVYYQIPVPYGEDFPRIRKILNAEFIQLYEDHRFLKGIPHCHGIENFSESSVDLCIRFMCEESERFDVQRFMHDEIMRIFIENDITIPFNQMDIHIENEFRQP